MAPIQLVQYLGQSLGSFRGHDRDGLVTQYFLFKNSIASVSNYFGIERKIILCITSGSFAIFIIYVIVDFQAM